MYSRQPENYTDHELLELMRRDDRDAFTRLYNRYWDKIFTVAMHRLGDEQEAEEVVQDIFLSLWQRRAEVTLSNSLATYLAVAVKYKIINILARQQRRQQHMTYAEQHVPRAEDSTGQWLSEKELKQQLEACISQLPEKCRIVFRLSREEGKTNAQIAHELDIAEKTAEAHITKALRTIRKSLQVSMPLLLALLEK